MDLYLKQTVQSLCIKALIFCLTGPLLFFAELGLWDRTVALSQVPAIILVSTLFFALSLAGQMIYLPMLRKGSKGVLGFYLLYKIIRLLLAVVLLVGYAFLHRENLLPFALNIIVLYLVEMITSIIHTAKMERYSKNKQ